MQKAQETQVQSLGREDTPEEEMATHSSILAWKIPHTEQPGRLQSTRFLCLWNFPGKNTGVGCLFLLQGIFPKAQMVRQDK